ncbi:PLP-dependent cysteine synthase family protein [Caulobacter segnis]|uniref:PLP-dependent cysteine synthase family protein n=1 Tax=Caulobacter segnis TaxID=88688 RepID=UPI00240F54E2|nr:PLP-dependent cysteine synthase family protein [Caulobacter segnis]MDG2522926.1 PLP-dependent cysteine synthase family protein [Caulobacter segnis]
MIDSPPSLPSTRSPSARHAPRSPAGCDRLSALSGLVGDTPLLAIQAKLDRRRFTIYAKAEFYNLTGSIKDRMALGVIAAAYGRGALVAGQEIVEATSGNAGIALAAVGRALGHPVTIFMPDWMSAERRALLRSHGAEIRLVSAEEGGFLGSIARAEQHAAQVGGFLSQQFANPDNWRAHYAGTAPELLAQMEAVGATPDAFVAGVGTGGTVMGVARHFRDVGLAASVHPVEPAESPTLSTGHKVGRHRIQGVSDEFIPEIVKLDELSAVIGVCDGDAILMAQRLAVELGLGVGISSGANMVAALKIAMTLPGTPAVATVFADNSARYLSTDLAREERVRDCYVAPRVELVDLRVI